MNPPDEIEHRYEQRGAEYTLRSWYDREMSVTASMVERPEWLVKIIDLAVVGGHMQRIPHPPPDLIVWFRTSKDSNELISFVDFGVDTSVSTPYVRTT
jgi:hypothetical protein